MILRDLQRQLERIYRLGSQPPIERFLVPAENAKTPGPRVLIKETEGVVFLAVQLGEKELHPENLADFLGAAEETSHFLYLTFRAQNERPVSLLDLEIQGEIDKYLLASLHFSAEKHLFEHLFERTRFHERLKKEAWDRYREAHRLGGKFVRSMGRLPDVLRFLRTFYRWSSPRRLATLAAW